MNRIVAKTEDEFWKRLENFTPARSVFEAQDDQHGDIDFRLVEKIDAYLFPRIGEWERSDRWFHNIDFYGDGIRLLEFTVDCFSPDYIHDFRSMLTGEHSEFTILCKVSMNFDDPESRIGSIAIRQDRILVSYPLTVYFSGRI